MSNNTLKGGGRGEAMTDERENASNPDLEEIRAAMQAEFKPMFPELQDVVINGRTMRAHEVLDVARKTMGGVADNEKGILMFVHALLTIHGAQAECAAINQAVRELKA